MRPQFPLPAITLLLTLPVPVLAQPVTPPAQHLGRPVGADFELADWSEVAGYFLRLGEESPNAETIRVGTTTEGRDFLITIVSSPENLGNLDFIKSCARTIADPRGRSDEEIEAAIAEGKVILFVSCAMHSTEVAGAQLGMELAYLLATSGEEPWASARRELVVVIYTTNPDGVDHVVDWYRRTVGTPHEASGLLKLYQHYSGHDNNRDWFMLTQAETRIVTTLLYAEWYPQVYWDVHQQGSRRERLFIPPFRDPLNPNLDPTIISAIDALGSRALLDLTREGFRGVSTGVSYDMWWNGGNRNVPVRHNIIGLLTEAASAELASPVFLPRSSLSPPAGLAGYHPSNQFPDPWPGGWWHLRDIIDYELAFGRSLLASLSRERPLWLRNSREAAERAIEQGRTGAPRAWLIPSDNRDPAAVRRLVDVLLASGVEVHVTDAALEADGRRYPAGTIVIRRDQPYGAHVKDLFDVQRYPGGRPPYDVAGWTLPFLLGVRRVEVMQELEAPIRLVRGTEEAAEAFHGDPRHDGERLSSRHSDSWAEVAERLAREQAVTLVVEGPDAGMLVPGELDEPEQGRLARTLPRIGVYAPWRGSMDEGWARYVLDTFGIAYSSVRNEMLRAGNLGDFLDVLVIPSVGARLLDRGRAEGSVPEEYTGGLSPEGAVAVEQFVFGGGTLITLGASSRWAVDLFEIPVIDATREPAAEGFSCPGSVLRGVVEPHPLTAGLSPTVAVFFSGDSAFRPLTADERKQRGEDEGDDEPEEERIETLLRYAPTRVMLSGWIQSPEVIEDRSAWLRVSHGAGRIHLFGFSPQYRGWSQATFPLLFRAMLFE